MTKGMNVAQDMLTAHPDVDGIWYANDMMGLGALAAAEKMGLKDILIASIDVDPEVVEIIKEDRPLKYTIGAYYICGAISAILMYDHLNGVAVPPRVEFSMLSVGHDNADKFMEVHGRRGLLKGKARSLSNFLTPNATEDRWQSVLALD